MLKNLAFILKNIIAYLQSNHKKPKIFSSKFYFSRKAFGNMFLSPIFI